jgi:hypothetical protein
MYKSPDKQRGVFIMSSTIRLRLNEILIEKQMSGRQLAKQITTHTTSAYKYPFSFV